MHSRNRTSTLEGIQKITFGNNPSDNKAILSFLLTVAGIGAFVVWYVHTVEVVLLGAAIAFGLLFGVAIVLDGRKSIEFDLEKSLYFISDGPGSFCKGRGGTFRDIRCISITRNPRAPYFSPMAQVEFHPDTPRNPYRLDELPCSVLEDSMLVYLDLATRLNIPLYDNSGWNGLHPPLENLGKITVPPGEAHPALLQPPPMPKKWNKW